MTKITILICILFLNISVNAQFFSEVNYIGSMDKDDWTKGWSDFTPIDNSYPESKITLSGVISKNTILSRGSSYLLVGNVYVANNATLYIEKGSVIKGDPNTKGTLVICRGSKIRAMGTKEEPIIFTSGNPVDKRKAGDWGGISLLGKAKINNPSGEAILEGNFDPLYSKYGGTYDDDCSGVLNFVRIEFAGRKISKDKELNGLSLCGVGNKTKLENIQVSYSGDDGFQFYGGSVNGKYLISFQSEDDCYEFSSGYRGKLQFGIALRHYKMADAGGSRAIESETYNEENGPHYSLLTSPVLSNFTLISPEIFYQQGSSDNIKEAVNLELGSALSFCNSLVLGFPVGAMFTGQETIGKIEDGTVNFRNNFLVGCLKPVSAINANNFDVNSWFVDPSLQNIFKSKSETDKVFRNPFNIFRPDFTIKDLIVKPDFNVLRKYDQITNDFFDKVSYRGAFGDTDWSIGWTCFDAAKQYNSGSIVKVSGTLFSSTRWSDNNIYLLQGNVIVKSGVTLSIDPGTVIFGESASKGTLIIEAGARIVAEGDINNPIIFTSENPAGKRKAGDWGGIVILGNGRIIPKKPQQSLKTLGTMLPDLKFGGEKENEDSGLLKYVRIEYAGGCLDKTKEISALTLAGVNSLNLDYVQISMSLNDGLTYAGGRNLSRHLVFFNNTDEDISCLMGFAGKAQYALMWREPIMASMNGANGIEVAGCSGLEDCNQMEQPEFSNFSIIGPNRKDVQHYNQNFKAALYVRKNASVSLNNSLVTNYPIALSFSSDEVNFNVLSLQLVFKNNIISNCKELLVSDQKDPFFINQWMKKESNKTLIVDYEELMLNSTANIHINLIPGNNSPCLNSDFECLNSDIGLIK
jgi:hypothetical protein